MEVPPTASPIYPLRESDYDKLGTLLYNAYYLTVDDEGGSEETAKQEAKETLTGKYGPVLWRCSFVIFSGNEMVSACIVIDKDGPFIPYIITHPNYKHMGFDNCLICHSIDALNNARQSTVRLVVTESNTAAYDLYLKLGFVQP
jgi:ribosomal protein S18 acetylase RimI-like enzyme